MLIMAEVASAMANNPDSAITMAMNFQPVGMRLDPAPEAPPIVDPSGISQVSIYILDKQQGPFEITIRSIDAGKPG